MSCLVPVANVDGASVKTLEGTTRGDGLAAAAGVPGRLRHPVRLLHAGHDHGRRGAARPEPDPTREEIVEALSGNVCRCTGYESIIDAIREAAA